MSPHGRGVEGIAAELGRLAASDPSLAGLPERLAPLLELLAQVEAGATLDVWIEFGGGHVVVADVAAEHRGIVRDAAGPGLGLEGTGGELVVLLHHIESVRRDHHTGGVRVLLATGESLWFRVVRPGHSGLSRPPRPSRA
ncbi:MAG TPA: glycine dehydrogenase [Thermaerobacter sp.]